MASPVWAFLKGSGVAFPDLVEFYDRNEGWIVMRDDQQLAMSCSLQIMLG